MKKILDGMNKIAVNLDKKGLFSLADAVTNLMQKLAWDPKEPDEGPTDWYGAPKYEPTTTLKEGQQLISEDGVLYGVVESISQDQDRDNKDVLYINVRLNVAHPDADESGLDEFVLESLDRNNNFTKTRNGDIISYIVYGETGEPTYPVPDRYKRRYY